MKKVIILLMVLTVLIFTVGCEKNNEDGAYDTGSASQNITESVSTGDNLVEFNDIDGNGESSSESTSKSQNDGETTTDREWTNIY